MLGQLDSATDLEQRRGPRYPLKNIWATWEGGEADIRNISNSGSLLAGPLPPRTEGRLDLVLQLPWIRPVLAPGRMVRAEGGRASDASWAVEFIAPSPELSDAVHLLACLAEPSHSFRKSVLFVRPRESVLAGAERLFAKLGHFVMHAATPLNTIETLIAHSFDLVFVDSRFAGEDPRKGWGFVSEAFPGTHVALLPCAEGPDEAGAKPAGEACPSCGMARRFGDDPEVLFCAECLLRSCWFADEFDDVGVGD